MDEDETFRFDLPFPLPFDHLPLEIPPAPPTRMYSIFHLLGLGAIFTCLSNLYALLSTERLIIILTWTWVGYVLDTIEILGIHVAIVWCLGIDIVSYMSFSVLLIRVGTDYLCGYLLRRLVAWGYLAG